MVAEMRWARWKRTAKTKVEIMPSKRPQIAVVLTDSQHDFLLKLSESEQISMGAIIRTALTLLERVIPKV